MHNDCQSGTDRNLHVPTQWNTFGFDEDSIFLSMLPVGCTMGKKGDNTCMHKLSFSVLFLFVQICTAMFVVVNSYNFAVVSIIGDAVSN